MTDRFVMNEDERAWLPGEDLPLITAHDLLLHLGAMDADSAVQRKAVTGWLSKNQPNEFLAESLVISGFQLVHSTRS